MFYLSDAFIYIARPRISKIYRSWWMIFHVCMVFTVNITVALEFSGSSIDSLGPVSSAAYSYKYHVGNFKHRHNRTFFIHFVFIVFI